MASAIQLLRQHFSTEESGHCMETIFFIIGFAGEVIYLLLVIIVPIGDNWDAVYTAAQDDPIVAALLALTAVTLVTAIFQFLMWMLCCGKNTSAD